VGREVRVGDRSYRVDPFNGRKAILASRMISRIFRKVPELVQADAEFRRQFIAANTVTVTQDQAQVEPYKTILAHLDAAAWKELGGKLTLPQHPSEEQRLIAAFPLIFELAEEEVLQLIALLVIPAGDLAEASAGGGAKDALAAIADELLDEGSMPELIEVIAAGADEIRMAFEESQDTLGKLRRLWGSDPEAEAAKQPEISSEPSTPTETPSSKTPTPTSVTDSDPPTDGDPTEPSTASPSAALSGSPAG
jgi:hypothetical protein